MVAFQRAAPCNIWIHGWWDRGFIRFQLCFVHALSHCQCNKFCPKSAQIRNFEIPPKIKVSMFLKYKISTCRGGTRTCFHCLDFQSKNFSYTIFIVKNGLCIWISAYPIVEIYYFLKVPHLVWAWDFVDIYLIHLRIRIWRGTYHIYLRKWFFWIPKDCYLPRVGAKKTFSSTLNVMI